MLKSCIWMNFSTDFFVCCSCWTAIESFSTLVGCDKLLAASSIIIGNFESFYSRGRQIGGISFERKELWKFQGVLVNTLESYQNGQLKAFFAEKISEFRREFKTKILRKINFFLKIFKACVEPVFNFHWHFEVMKHLILELGQGNAIF